MKAQSNGQYSAEGLSHYDTFCTSLQVSPKNSFSCSSQSFYDFFSQQIKLNYFLTKEQKKRILKILTKFCWQLP